MNPECETPWRDILIGISVLMLAVSAIMGIGVIGDYVMRHQNQIKCECK